MSKCEVDEVEFLGALQALETLANLSLGNDDLHLLKGEHLASSLRCIRRRFEKATHNAFAIEPPESSH